MSKTVVPEKVPEKSSKACILGSFSEEDATDVLDATGSLPDTTKWTLPELIDYINAHSSAPDGININISGGESDEVILEELNR